MIRALFRFIIFYFTNHCKRTEFNIWSIILLVANYVVHLAFPAVPVYLFNSIYFFCVILRQFRLPYDGEAVLITGCDSGFGFLLAKELKREGCDVIDI